MAVQLSLQPTSVSNNGHPVKHQVSGDSTGAFPSPSVKFIKLIAGDGWQYFNS